MRISRGLKAMLLFALCFAVMVGCTANSTSKTVSGVTVTPTTSAAPPPSTTVSQSMTKVRVTEVIHSVFYAPQYVALHQGFFAEEGLDVELGIAWGADRGAAALLSGAADIGLFGPESAIYILAQGAENPVQAFAQLTKRDGSFLVARPGTTDFSWADVKGKTIIGGRKGGVPEMVLEYTLRLNEITPFEDVEILQNIALDATAAAFAGGTGDFVQLWEPGASALVASGHGVIVASLGVDAGEVPYTVFHATQNYIKQNPEIVEKFTRAIYKAQAWVEQQPADEVAKVILSEFPDTSTEELAAVIASYKELDIWAKDPLFSPEAMDKMQMIMIEAGELTPEEKQEYNSLVRPEFASGVMNP